MERPCSISALADIFFFSDDAPHLSMCAATATPRPAHEKAIIIALDAVCLHRMVCVFLPLKLRLCFSLFKSASWMDSDTESTRRRCFISYFHLTPILNLAVVILSPFRGLDSSIDLSQTWIVKYSELLRYKLNTQGHFLMNQIHGTSNHPEVPNENPEAEDNMELLNVGYRPDQMEAYHAIAQEHDMDLVRSGSRIDEKLGVFSVFCLISNNMIGSGIFTSPGVILEVC